MDRGHAEHLVSHFVAPYNDGDLNHFDECLAVAYRHPNPASQGRDGMRKAVRRWRDAVDPISLTLDDLIVEGDKIVARMTFAGRQVGDILGIPASGRTFSVGLIDIFLVEDGLLAQHWDQMDLLGLYRQLGALPES
jgi:predicted ester cyclase